MRIGILKNLRYKQNAKGYNHHAATSPHFTGHLY